MAIFVFDFDFCYFKLEMNNFACNYYENEDLISVKSDLQDVNKIMYILLTLTKIRKITLHQDSVPTSHHFRTVIRIYL